jgi:threonine dehydratase
MSPNQHRLSLDHISLAAKTIDPVFLDSPQFISNGLSANFGCDLTLKLETANPIGSFKGRGASFFIQQVIASNRVRPMVCASAGNFGQALAYACRSHGLPLTVFASIHANPLKVAKMRSFGATVVLEGEDFDAAKLAANQWATNNKTWMVEDGREPEISEGAGTIAVELLHRGDTFDAILIPLGNGALLTGIARWIKARAPATKVFGISSVHAPAMHDSWKAHRIIEYPTAKTIADGIAVRIPIPEAVSDMNNIVDDVYLINESSIITAMKLLHEHERLLVEPAGAVGLAALVEHPTLSTFRRIATIVCGNNITHDQQRSHLFT